MVQEAKRGELWSRDDFIRTQQMAANATERLNSLGDLKKFWDEKQDALKRLIAKKNIPFK